MARTSEQFRQSDVTLWGLVALVLVGLAVFGSNISMLVPQSLIAGLHQPRVAGASIETLRQQVGDLITQASQLKRENELLVSRFALQEKAGGEVVRRVGALEVTVPQLLEAMPMDRAVDRQLLTSSVGTGETLVFDAEGGSVAVRQAPLPGLVAPSTVDQPLPAPIESASAELPTPAQHGVAVGTAASPDSMDALWSELTIKLGPVLFGLVPLVMEDPGRGTSRIVVGPFAELGDAMALCQRIERVSIACSPVPYEGVPLVNQ